MSAAQGTTQALLATFFTYAGGPGADLTGIAITIGPAAGGTPVIGPTSVGINHPATGVYTYSWAISPTQTLGDYLAIWSGTDLDGDLITATEIITVVSSTIDYTSSLGLVRLLIPDVDEANLILTDGQITAFLGLEGGNVKLAAAQALDAIAVSEALVSKVIKTQDLSTNGAAVAASLQARAKELRRQVADGEGDDSTGFDIVDFIDPFTRTDYTY